MYNNPCELSEVKVNVRQGILNQVVECFGQGYNGLQYVSLPGQFFFFEKRMIQQFQKLFEQRKAVLQCHEIVSAIFQRQESGFHEIDASKDWKLLGKKDRSFKPFISYHKDEVGSRSCSPPPQVEKPLQGAWLDFCGYPDSTRLEIARKTIEKSDIAHFTFNLNVRKANDCELNKMTARKTYEGREDWLHHKLQVPGSELVYITRYYSGSAWFITIGYAKSHLKVTPVLQGASQWRNKINPIRLSPEIKARVLLNYGYWTDEISKLTGLPQSKVVSLAARMAAA